MKNFEISGLIAAPVTPMYENGEVNYDVIEEYVDILVKQSINHVYVNGTNGEGLSLTTSERKLLLEKWIQFGRKKLGKIIAQVGSASLWDTKELARHAEDVGADAIGVLPPIFFKPSSVEDLIDYLKEVSAAAPNLPLLYYHFPDITNLQLPITEIVEKSAEKIPTFCGVKFTDYNLLDFGRCLINDKFGRNLIMAYGRDEQLVGALLLGATTAVGGTYNYAGKVYSRMYDAVKKGDMKTASLCQRQSQQFLDVFLNHGFNVGVNKSIMEMITGLKCGPPRLPLRSASEDQLLKIEKDLKRIGFFEFRK